MCNVRRLFNLESVVAVRRLPFILFNAENDLSLNAFIAEELLKSTFLYSQPLSKVANAKCPKIFDVIRN